MKRLTKRQVLRLSSLSLAIGLAIQQITPAYADTTTWLGGTFGNWSDASRWSGGTVPSSVDVWIDGGNAAASLVLLDTAATVSSLVIDAGDALVLSSQTLTLNGPVTNNGSLALNGGVILVSSDIALGGSGQTILSGGYIDSANGYAGNTVTIGTGHTLKGYGYLGYYYGYNATSFVNQGVILADSPGRTLNVYGPSLNNSAGLIQVGNGATLNVLSGAITGGTLQSLGTATITGAGQFSDLLIKGGMNVQGSAFKNVTFEDDNVINSTATIGGAITNKGSITVNGTALLLASDTSLSGSGQTVLKGGYVESSNGYSGNTLTIEAGHTLKGYGYLGGAYYGYNATRIVNKGTIWADTPGNVLYFYGPSLDNTAGQIQVSDNATFYAVNGLVTGGVLQSLGAATLGGGGSFAQVLIKGGFNVSGSSFTDVVFEDDNVIVSSANMGGTIQNKGSITVTGTALTLVSDVSLSGAGQTVLKGGYIESGNGYTGNTLTIESGHTLKGHGNLGGGYYGYNSTKVINKGTILADNTSGSALNVYAPSLNNAAGMIQVASGATLYLYNGTVNGGTVQGLGAGNIAGGGNFASLTIKGGFNITGSSFTDVTFEDANAINSNITVAGTITNKGTLSLNSSLLNFSSDVTLTGSGQTVLNGGYVESSNGYSSNTLTIDTGHTLRGYGQLAGGYYGYNATRVLNKGYILADSTAGYALSFYGSSLDNSAGLIQVASGATLNVYNGIVSGGTVQSLGTANIGGTGNFANLVLKGGFTLAGSSFTDVTFEDANTVTGSISIGGTLTNKGALTFNGTLLSFSSDVTLAGSGQTVLKGGYVESTNGYSSNTLTIGSGHTLKGYGQLGGGYYGYNSTRIVNKGVIQADGTAGYTLAFQGSSLDNSAGLIQVADGAQFYGSGGTVSGGTVEGLGSGNAMLSGGTYRDLTLKGKLQSSSLTVGGTINNQGVLSIRSGVLTFATDTTLAGNGQTVLNGGYIESSNGITSNTLTIAAGHTLRGYGQLAGGYYGYNATRIVNHGTVRADETTGHVLNVYGPEFKNRGTLQVDKGANAQLYYANLVQDDAAAKTIVDGTLGTKLVDLQAGELSGTGTISGDVTNSGGRVKPGASPGKLTIGGNYTQTSGGSLVIDIDGPDQGLDYDWLTIVGMAALSGDLYLDIGYTPADGTTFTFLTALAGVTGVFDHIHANGWNVTTNYGPTDVSVTLTAAVPEPESILLMLAGLGVFGIKARRRATVRV